MVNQVLLSSLYLCSHNPKNEPTRGLDLTRYRELEEITETGNSVIAVHQVLMSAPVSSL